MGLNAAGQQAGMYGTYGNNVANIYGNGANYAADTTQGIGNVTAAGQVGGANAWGNAIGNIGADLSTIYANQGRGLYRKPSA
jgi:hypothetical protein